jgi:hypothetical protein
LIGWLVVAFAAAAVGAVASARAADFYSQLTRPDSEFGAAPSAPHLEMAPVSSSASPRQNENRHDFSPQSHRGSQSERCTAQRAASTCFEMNPEIISAEGLTFVSSVPSWFNFSSPKTDTASFDPAPYGPLVAIPRLPPHLRYLL